MAFLLEQSEQKALQQLRQWWRRVPSSQNVNAFPQRTHSSSSLSTVAVISGAILQAVTKKNRNVHNKTGRTGHGRRQR